MAKIPKSGVNIHDHHMLRLRKIATGNVVNELVCPDWALATKKKALWVCKLTTTDRLP